MDKWFRDTHFRTPSRACLKGEEEREVEFNTSKITLHVVKMGNNNNNNNNELPNFSENIGREKEGVVCVAGCMAWGRRCKDDD